MDGAHPRFGADQKQHLGRPSILERLRVESRSRVLPHEAVDEGVVAFELLDCRPGLLVADAFQRVRSHLALDEESTTPPRELEQRIRDDEPVIGLPGVHAVLLPGQANGLRRHPAKRKTPHVHAPVRSNPGGGELHEKVVEGEVVVEELVPAILPRRLEFLPTRLRRNPVPQRCQRPGHVTVAGLTAELDSPQVRLAERLHSLAAQCPQPRHTAVPMAPSKSNLQQLVRRQMTHHRQQHHQLPVALGHPLPLRQQRPLFAHLLPLLFNNPDALPARPQHPESTTYRGTTPAPPQPRRRRFRRFLAVASDFAFDSFLPTSPPPLSPESDQIAPISPDRERGRERSGTTFTAPPPPLLDSHCRAPLPDPSISSLRERGREAVRRVARSCSRCGAVAGRRSDALDVSPSAGPSGAAAAPTSGRRWGSRHRIRWGSRRV